MVGQSKGFSRSGGTDYVLKVGNNVPLSKATEFSHCLYLYEELLLKKKKTQSSLLGVAITPV